MPRKIKLFPVSKNAIKRLENYLRTPPHSYIEARDKLILSLFYHQGFRIGLVQLLRVRHYDTKDNILYIPRDYGLSGVLSILPEDVTLLHLKHIVRYSHLPDAPLLKSMAMDRPVDIPLSIRQIQRIVRSKLMRLGFTKNLCPRMLRHRCAIRLAKEKLKHKSLDNLIGRVSPWVFTAYKRRAGNFSKPGKI